MNKFKFELKANVTNIVSGESGIVAARMESINTTNQYLVEHVEHGSGKMSELWWYERQIKPTPAAPKAVAKKSAPKKRAVKKSVPVPQPV